MFERYTEPARRVIFFARYEASQYGSTTIETEHFLLGLIREDKTLQRFLSASAPLTSIRERIDQRVEIRSKVSTSIDLPLSDECKRILAHSAREAEKLKQGYIGTDHLLLGILCEPDCTAAKVLTELGLKQDAAREEASRHPSTLEPTPGRPIPHTPLPLAGVVPDAETAMKIAEAVWSRHSAPAENAKALSAALIHGVWLVIGSQMAAFIQKEDGKILRIHRETTAS